MSLPPLASAHIDNTQRLDTQQNNWNRTRHTQDAWREASYNVAYEL